MKDENLLLWNDDQFSSPPQKPSVISEINDGEVWRKGYKAFIQDNSYEVLCLLLLFIDKTHTDLHGNLCLEPISFTLGIFKRMIRNQPWAWRNMGYVINQALKKYKNALDRASDYHAVLDIIFEPLRKLQARGGIAWRLQHKGQVHNVVFKIPVLLIIGDTDSHDKMCGKFLNHNNKVKRLCRYCDCPAPETGNPDVSF